MIGIFGHAGDGNMHPTIVHDHGDLEGEKRAKLAFSEIVAIAQNLGGTASGEHGIGSIKRDMVGDETSASVLNLQREIKKLFDPSGILNPGKKLP
jgi:glycolate oxidase